MGMIGVREKDYCKEVAIIVYNIDVSNKNTSFNSDSDCNGGHNNSYIIMVVAITIVKPPLYIALIISAIFFLLVQLGGYTRIYKKRKHSKCFWLKDIVN
jgi:hypothetical protein